MALHETESAVKFDTKEACQSWITDRIVRFKLLVSHGRDKHGNFAIGPLRKDKGQIMDTKVEDFKPGGIDEPLGNYAEPTKHEGKWMAVMKVRE